MKNKKFSFVDLADDLYIEENIINDEKDIIEDKLKQEVEKTKEVKLEPKIEKITEVIKEEIKLEPKIEKIVEKKVVKKETSPPNSKNNVFFKEKEKLDIKTNIYLKKENYSKIEQIYKNTGNSRSSIINKLIEIALDKIEEN